MSEDPQTRGSKARVLVVEDDGLVAEMVSEVLSEQGYTVIGMAPDGHAAIHAVADLEPDVVVMDLRMPEMDGIEATRRIQQIHPTPIVMLTARDSLELTEEAAAAGVGAYLVKPPNGRDLARAITVARARFEERQNLNAFAHTVAHDLKNAMTPIVGVAQLLREDLDALPVEHAQVQLDVIADQGKMLSRMVDELLMLAEANDRLLDPEPLDMAVVVEEARKGVAPLIEEVDARITVPDAWPPVLGHGPWVAQVWVNYLSNALKYGGTPPVIVLGWDPPGPGDTHVRFWIRDNGAGLEPEQAARLFEPYVRLHDDSGAGHGLGLSIVRRIIDKLGGEVGVESQPGEGCTFWFTLRLAD